MFSSRRCWGLVAAGVLSGHLVSVKGADLSMRLPTINSIAAGGDVRVFLRPDVPAELVRKALHIAWTADPAIRDCVGIADNEWDFNVQGAIPGFGTLEPAELTRQLIERALGRIGGG